MQDIVLVGAGGCMRELVWQIQELNKVKPTWNIIGYVDRGIPQEDVIIGKQGIPYLGADDFLITYDDVINVAVCVGSPHLREKIVSNLKKNEKIHFPNLILSETYVCEDVQIGHGCIISMDARISTNVKIGNFVFLNTGSKICHDGSLGDFVTLSPDVKLAGDVHIGDYTELGIGSNVIQGISIGDNVVIGAGAVVVKSIASSCTAVGVPAKVIKCF